MSKEAAEAAAANARQMLREGRDPVQERAAALRANEIQRKTFGDVVEEWIADRAPFWRPNVLQARRIIFANPRFNTWRDRSIGSITVREVQKHAAGVNPNSQQAQLGPLRSVFKFAEQAGYIKRSPFTEGRISIARAEGNAEPLIVFHEGRAPDFSELVAVLDCIDACEAVMPRSPWWNIWRVCVFTGQRPSAVIGLRWDELRLDGDEPVWNLPASRSKIKRDSTIPLSADCAAILRDIPHGDSELVWPGRGGGVLSYPEGDVKLLNGMLAAKGFPAGWRPGRARDSLASWLEFQSDATERSMALLLGHKPPSDNVRRKHYARVGAAHQARVLVERYANAIREARQGATDRVIPIRTAG